MLNDTTGLGSFYGRAIDAIRAAEASTKGGFEHPVFFEPGVLWSAAGTNPTPPPTFTDDENIIFSPHLYAESIAAHLDRGGLRQRPAGSRHLRHHGLVR